MFQIRYNQLGAAVAQMYRPRPNMSPLSFCCTWKAGWLGEDHVRRILAYLKNINVRMNAARIRQATHLDSFFWTDEPQHQFPQPRALSLCACQYSRQELWSPIGPCNRPVETVKSQLLLRNMPIMVTHLEAVDENNSAVLAATYNCLGLLWMPYNSEHRATKHNVIQQQAIWNIPNDQTVIISPTRQPVAQWRECNGVDGIGMATGECVPRQVWRE